MESIRHDIELWGGIECSFVRVGDAYVDELALSRHTGHVAEDVARLACLGIKKLRAPILWERSLANANHRPDWRYSDALVEALVKHGIDPIAGLLHHGSGPQHTSLVDPDFACQLAEYAYLVAERYPHIMHYTPVNEPLTTARFSGLYGLWYPHHRSDKSFVTALINEMAGTQLAMQAVRQVQPEAVLVLTEDLGYTHSTPKLAYQARFENERRWLSFDLAQGRVRRGHKMWRYLEKHGADLATLAQLERGCGETIFGLNHYVTSERYLDERLALYAQVEAGGNKRHRYVDIEVARTGEAERFGLAKLALQVWDRYKAPLAVTEWHLGCTREEQLRWLQEGHKECGKLLTHGVDLRGFTPWAMLGSYDWDSLLTKPRGHYEPGAFDVRTGEPRITALGRMIANGCVPTDKQRFAVDGAGWWHSMLDVRCSMLEKTRTAKVLELDRNSNVAVRHFTFLQHPKSSIEHRPLLITGATGTLGQAFARACKQRGLRYVTTNRTQLDITRPEMVHTVVGLLNPWAVINTAGFVRVDEAEHEYQKDDCWAQNALGPANLADTCRKVGARLVQFSSDLVFDGKKTNMYDEGDRPKPLNQYGRSKAYAEEAVLDILPSALIVRTAAFFSPWDAHNFVHHLTHTLEKGMPFDALNDSKVSPTYVPHLIHEVLDLLIDEEQGIAHLTNAGGDSWYEICRYVAEMRGLPEELVIPKSQVEMGLAARRPADVRLTDTRFGTMPSLEAGLHAWLGQMPDRGMVKV